MKKRCKHDKNFTISEEVIAETVFNCRSGAFLEEGNGIHSDHFPTGWVGFKCADCGKEGRFNLFSKSTPAFVKSAWNKLMQLHECGVLA